VARRALRSPSFHSLQQEARSMITKMDIGFRKKIMLKTKSWSGMTIRKKVISL
jgi:hypothetical protein